MTNDKLGVVRVPSVFFASVNSKVRTCGAVKPIINAILFFFTSSYNATCWTTKLEQYFVIRLNRDTDKKAQSCVQNSVNAIWPLRETRRRIRLHACWVNFHFRQKRKGQWSAFWSEVRFVTSLFLSTSQMGSLHTLDTRIWHIRVWNVTIWVTVVTSSFRVTTWKMQVCNRMMRLYLPKDGLRSNFLWPKYLWLSSWMPWCNHLIHMLILEFLSSESPPLRCSDRKVGNKKEMFSEKALTTVQRCAWLIVFRSERL